MAPFLERRKVLFDGIEVRGRRRQQEERVTRLLDQLTRLRRFMKGGIVPDQDRVRSQLLKAMLGEPGIEPLGLRPALKQHRSAELLPTLPGQQAGPRPRVPTPLPGHRMASTSPASGTMGRSLKPTFIQIDHLG